ncbi:MAG TPA: XRE family transcriptional regulator [Erysipelotrichaceae bacterium]|nr:XRE family transcriptional regulator [Erysipelotrichaceae bacterium]
MQLSDILKEYKDKTGFSDDYIAQHLNVSRSTVNRWVSGDTKKVQPKIIAKLSELMNLDIEEILTSSLFMIQKPILGYAKAGYDLFAEENYLGYEMVTSEEDRDGDYFLKVEGDSMIGAKIHDGDLVYVKKTNTVNNNEIAVVLVGEEVTIKKVIQKDEILILEAANAAYENKYFTKAEVSELPVSIIGRVVYSKTMF